MRLFGNKKQPLPELITEADYDEVANYESALNYLVGLSGDDYTKVTQVAAIHRQANYEAAKVLGVDDAPTTFIYPPEPAEPTDEPDFLDGLKDDLAGLSDKDLKKAGKQIKVKE